VVEKNSAAALGFSRNKSKPMALGFVGVGSLALVVFGCACFQADVGARCSLTGRVLDRSTKTLLTGRGGLALDVIVANGVTGIDRPVAPSL